MKFFSCSLFLFSILLQSKAFAWGPMGHRMIAETAAVLVQKNALSADWGAFLSSHRVSLGIYSNYPDTLYKTTEITQSRQEAGTHYFDVDILREAFQVKSLKEFPEGYEAFQKKASEKVDPKVLARIGSGPWRMEQFYQAAFDYLVGIKDLQGKVQMGSAAKGDTLKLYQGLVYLGLLSHYMGDATMPYHASSDYDGAKTKEKGIHAYFEIDCVNALEPGLSSEVLKLASKKQSQWEKQWIQLTPVAVAFLVYKDSYSRIADLSKIDLSKVVQKGSDPVIRKSAEKGCPAFKSLIVEQLAKGAVLTAYWWGKLSPIDVDLKKLREIQFVDYESQPHYVEPAYLNGVKK